MPADSPEDQDLDADLAEVWRAVARPYLDVRARWFEVAEDVGLSPAGLDALLKVDADHPPSMREMAELLGCDASYVTAMVDDLERTQYANRRPSDLDRRVKMIVLTAAGRRAQERARERLMAPPAQLRNLSPERQRELADLLRQALGHS
ncbi:MAG: MarR family winged helix-turn-helix transcriptional regulator [Actinomycetes bacterium]